MRSRVPGGHRCGAGCLPLLRGRRARSARRDDRLIRRLRAPHRSTRALRVSEPLPLLIRESAAVARCRATSGNGVLPRGARTAVSCPPSAAQSSGRFLCGVFGEKERVRAARNVALFIGIEVVYAVLLSLVARMPLGFGASILIVACVLTLPMLPIYLAVVAHIP